MITPPGTPNPLDGLTPRADVQIKVVLMNEHSRMPTRGSADAAGFDLYANLADERGIKAPLTIKAGSIAKVFVGVAFGIPQGYEGQIRPRSGLALRGVTVVNAPGTLDADYRGPVMVILHTKDDLLLTHNMRIAQVVFQRVPTVELVPVESLDETARGTGGFGSTGH